MASERYKRFPCKEHNAHNTSERIDTLCRRFQEAQEAFWISSDEFAEAYDVSPSAFKDWLAARGIKSNFRNGGHWRRYSYRYGDV